jgi:hypothetical protein
VPNEGLETTAQYWDAYMDRNMVDGQNTNQAEWLAHPLVQERHEVARGQRALETWVAEVALGGARRNRGWGLVPARGRQS